MHKKTWYLTTCICMALCLAGCGNKGNNVDRDALPITEQAKVSNSDNTAASDETAASDNTAASDETAASDNTAASDESAKENTKMTGTVNLKEAFKGTVIVDGLEITLPCRIETLENKEDFLAHYKKLYEDNNSLSISLLNFVYDNESLPMEKRIITGVHMHSFDKNPIEVILPDGTNLLPESKEQLEADFGTPDESRVTVTSEESELTDHTYENDFGTIYFSTEKILKETGLDTYKSVSIFADSTKINEMKQSIFDEAGKTSDGWKSGLFLIDNKFYSTYSSLYDFTFNGWEAHPKHENLVYETFLNPGEIEDKESPILILDKEESYIRFAVKNREDYEASIWNCSILQLTCLFTDIAYELPGGIKNKSSMADVKALYGDPISTKEMKGIEGPYQNKYPDFTANYYMDSADGWEKEDIALCIYSDTDGNVCGFRYRNNAK